MLREAMKPYIAPLDSGARVSTIRRIIHQLSLQQSWSKATPMDNYRILLQALIERFGVDRNYLAKEAIKDNIKHGFIIQHDVDINIVSALQMAELEHDMGVRSTFYILHNAMYYCFWSKDLVYRHNSMIYIYRYIQDLGHEVGIHIDPLDIIQGRNMDGLQAMKTEVRWMRDNGLNVVSMMSHNSWRAYGANNWEVFKGRNEREEVKGFNLGTIDEKAFGLECDAYDVLRKLSPVTFITPSWDNTYRVTDDFYRSKKQSDLHGVEGPLISYDATEESVNNSDICLVTAHPVYYQAKQQAEVTIVNVLSLTKSGTTLLLMLIASDCENKAFALGHANNLYNGKPVKCMYHRPNCEFWDYFLWDHDPNENLFCQIANQAHVTHIITENLSFDPSIGMIADLQDPRVEIKTIFNVRDGRGVLASYWRINPHLPFESALKWYYDAVTNWHPPKGAFVVHYEDIIQDPVFELKRIGQYVGLKYSKELLSHWKEGHHQISGNFHATDKKYHSRYAKTDENVLRHDERWKTELTPENLKLFDKYCGEINASFGYQ